MTLPRFTAETSLYRTNRRYSTNGREVWTRYGNDRTAALVVPQVSVEGAMQCLQGNSCTRCLTGGGSIEHVVDCALCDGCLIDVLIH
jgi:hypothetical protein